MSKESRIALDVDQPLLLTMEQCLAEITRLRAALEQSKRPVGDAEIEDLLAKCARNKAQKGYRLAAFVLRSLAAARADLVRVRELHIPQGKPNVFFCDGCEDEWPCRTIRALR